MAAFSARISCLAFSPFWWTNPGGMRLMRMSWLLCVLLGTLAWGQAAPSAPPPQPAQTPAAPAAKAQGPADTAVPDDAAVLTVTGVCEPKPKPAAAKDATAKPAVPKSTESS